MKNGFKIFFCFLFLFAAFLIWPAFFAQAQGLGDAFNTGEGGALEDTARQAGFKTADGNDLYASASAIIKFSLSFLGIIFLGLMIYGGWLWMTDQGNEEQVEKAKKIIVAAVIGIIIVASSYAISWFIINALSQKTIIGA